MPSTRGPRTLALVLAAFTGTHLTRPPADGALWMPANSGWLRRRVGGGRRAPPIVLSLAAGAIGAAVLAASRIIAFAAAAAFVTGHEGNAARKQRRQP